MPRGLRIGHTGNSAPAWLSGMTAKTWSQPFTNVLDDVAPSPEPTTGAAVKIFTYGGGRVTDDGFYGFGGGHADYAGNEKYRGLLSDLAFTRLTDPSTESGGNEIQWGDGQPRPPHTYRHLTKAGSTLYLTGQAGPYPSVNTRQTVWKSTVAGSWSYVTEITDGTFGGGWECGSFYSPTRNKVYIISTYGEVWTLDCTNDSVTNAGVPSFVAGAAGAECAAAIIDQADALLFWASDGSVSVIDLDNLSSGWDEVTVSGTFGVDNYPGLAWHPRTNRLVGWGHTTNRANVYTLAPPVASPSSYADLLGTWTAASQSADGSNAVTPSTQNATGTHGCFGIIEYDDIDCAMLLNGYTEEPYIYRLPSAW